MELRVRADGFSKSRATPWPAEDAARAGRWPASWSTRSKSVGREVVDIEEIGHGVSLRFGAARVGVGQDPGHDLGQDGQGGIDLVVGDQQGWGHPDRIGSHGVDQEAAARARRPTTSLAEGWPSCAARRSPAPRTETTPGRPARPGRQPRPGPSGPAAHVLGLHHGQGGPCRGQGQGLTAEGRAVIAGPEGRRHLGPGPAGADRHAVAQRLGHGHHVGLEPLGLEGEPVAGAPEAGLHLIEHQEGVPLGAQRPHGAQVVRARHLDAALALQRLEQDGGHRVDAGRARRRARRTSS